MFDVDGTLVDSSGFDGALYAQAVREVLDVDVDETWLSYENVTDSGVLEEILAPRALDRPAEALRAAVKRRFVDLVRNHLALHPVGVREVAGARALIDRLVAMPSVRVAIATGGWRETAALKLERIGLKIEALAAATASDGVERTKIMALAEARAMLGVAPSSKTYFGDGVWDKQASAELGYRFVAIGRNVEHEIAFDDFTDVDAVLACLA